MKIRNKKGDFASIIYIIIFLFVVGIIFLFVNHLNNIIFTELEISFNETKPGDWNESKLFLGEIKEVDNSVWDYAFLGIFIGCLIALGLTAYAVKISPVFYWIYGVMSLFVLGIVVMGSNLWQEASSDAEFAVTITRFPMTNFILGSYYPIIGLVIIILAMIIMFGKPPGQEGFV